MYSGLFAEIRANPLIYHDWICFRNSFRRAFKGLRDRLLLLAIGGIALAALAEAIKHPMSVGPFIPIAIMALAGVSTQHAVRSRQAWLGAHSFLAAPALNPRLARHHLRTRHALAFGALVGLMLLISPGGLVGGAPAYLVGAMLGGVALPRQRRTFSPSLRAVTALPVGGSLFAILLRQQTGLTRPRSRWSALVAAASITAGAHMALVATSGMAVATIVLTGIGSIILIRLTRVDGATIRFANAHGLRTTHILAAHLPAPSAFILLTTSLLIPFQPIAATTMFVLGLLFFWTMILRVLVRHALSDAEADRLLSLLAIALALLSTFLKWLTPLLLLGFTIHLARRARQSRWTLP